MTHNWQTWLRCLLLGHQWWGCIFGGMFPRCARCGVLSPWSRRVLAERKGPPRGRTELVAALIDGEWGREKAAATKGIDK